MATDPATQTTTLYGNFPNYIVSQRANSVQASTLISRVSTIFNSDYEAVRGSWMKEVTDTLVSLGYWKGSA